jgi:hypothetical protein
LPRRRRAAYKARVLCVAWAIAGTLALAPASSPASVSNGEPGASSSAPQEPAQLVLGPDHQGALTVVDDHGHAVADVALRPGRRTLVALPAGRYTLRDPSGEVLDTLELTPGEIRAPTLPATFSSPAPARVPSASPAVRPAVVTGRLGPASPSAEREVQLVRRRRWARWAAPLVSAVVPGAGQAIIDGQPGRGLAVFTGTVGLVLGAVAVWAVRDPSNGASGDGAGRDAQEIVRLGGFAGLTTAAGLLYLGQILDAHAQAVDRRPPRPMRDHVLALEVSRATTVGFAAGQPAYALYSDWSFAIMGQLAPRVSLGLADASLKLARPRNMVTVQAGVRATYRFFDRRRVWLATGGGVLLQGTRADPAREPLVPEPGAPDPDPERVFSAVPYVLFDARLFLLDRWSLGLVPRVSLPLLARRFSGGRTLPRYTTTFELGAVLGVYF